MTKPQPTRSTQRGLSLIELMIGIAIGLFIIAAAGSLLVGQLHEHRALALEARLMQDLRSAADLVTRDLRRAGYWGHAGRPSPNPYAAVTPAAGTADNVSLRYSMDATENDALDGNEQFGFRLRGGAIELQLGAGNWQALTDANVLTVSAFSITPDVQEISLESACATACAAAGTCPRQRLRSFAVAISASLVADARVSRTLRSQARLRSDAVDGQCAL